ncbi:amidohydrolase family protein [Chitinophaga agrisoli]|nr:amidohydrolase family protein [Chitinophaga agrisoli]
MKKLPMMVAALLYLTQQANAQTYIIHANVVDVLTHKILADQTVVIQDKLIQQTGPSKKITPMAGATVIDATGKWVMPGLVDAHVHFFQTGGLYTRPDALDLRKFHPYEKEIEWYKAHMEAQLRRYVSCGITTVLDMGATYNLLQLRDSLAGQWYSPRILMAGPLVSTAYSPKTFDLLPTGDAPFLPVHTPDEALKATQQQYSHHPDMIKIWYITEAADATGSAREREPMVKAVTTDAQAHHYPVAVHATELLPARLAVEAGAHYLVHSVDDAVIDDSFIQLLKQRQAVLCPTLTVIDNYYKTFSQQYAPTAEDYTKADPEQLGSLQELGHLPDSVIAAQYKRLAAQRAQGNARADSISAINLKKLVDAGIPVATGTDAGNIGTLHASSYFKELRAMQHAGMNNWQLLTASTINGAKAAGKEKDLGSITAGKTADLLILNGNPVDDLQQLEQIAYVVNHGRVLRPDTLLQDSPEDIVQRQVNAYNAHDLHAFLSFYADDATLYNFPDQQIAKGKETMRKMYGFLEKAPGLHVTVSNRIVRNNVIIDHEVLTTAADKTGRNAVAIYVVEGQRINKVYFIIK